MDKIIAILLLAVSLSYGASDPARDFAAMEKYQFKQLGEDNKAFFNIIHAINQERFVKQKPTVKLGILMNYSDALPKSFRDTIGPTYTSFYSATLKNAYWEEGNIEIVERLDLHTVLKEHHLGQTGVLDSSPAPTALASATHLLIVSWAFFSHDRITENTKFVEAKSGEVLATYARYHAIPKQ